VAFHRKAKVQSDSVRSPKQVLELNTLLDDTMRQRILVQITPSPEEIALQQNLISSISDVLRERATKIRQKYSFIEAEGSTGGKQTQLRGAGDVDLFIGLRPKDFADILRQPAAKRDAALSSALDRLVDRWFVPAVKSLDVRDVMKTYSQHPYLSLTMQGVEIDVVACFDIRPADLAAKGPITAVDRTVHHTRYVSEKMNSRAREDARLLKSFVRASHAYGDKSAVGRTGFTGYSLELLVLALGSLDEAIRRLLSLEQDPVDPLDRKADELQKKPAFRDDHLFIIDPTDTERNVASSFSPRAYQWIKRRAARLMELSQGGDREALFQMFIEKPIPVTPLPAWISGHAFSREFISDGTVHYTVLRDKLHRVCGEMIRALETERTGEDRFGKVLAEVLFENTHFCAGFIVENQEIGPSYTRRGPPVSIVEAVDRFKHDHPDAYEKDGYLWLDVARETSSASVALDSLVRSIGIRGLKRSRARTVLSDQVLNVLYRYVMQVEDFPLKERQEFKDAAPSLGD